MQTPAGIVPKIGSELTFRDRLGTVKVRCAIGRMTYTVDPGLYALGAPGPHSPVLVSANYKLSFDRLRQALPGRSAWILVLDTAGVNVWCAAGKGTFGTAELVDRIRNSRLEQLVEHRQVIVPQLGAPGIAAHEVKKHSGFKVIYGPICASDLAAFIDSGYKATPPMRIKTFTTGERLTLVPVELIFALRTLLLICPVIFVLSGFAYGAGFLSNAIRYGIVNTLGFATGILAGCAATPLLLPWLPGRAFSVKGIPPGIAGALLFLLLRMNSGFVTPPGPLEATAWFFIIPAVSAYYAMNFTGCSTFTSLSGVKKEMRRAVPFQIAAMAAGILLWAVSRFL